MFHAASNDPGRLPFFLPAPNRFDFVPCLHFVSTFPSGLWVLQLLDHAWLNMILILILCLRGS